jgi:hypothetical protein
MHVHGQEFGVEYWPGDSRSGMFGGNSNWRGPIWLAVNFLLIESLQRFHQYYGESLQVECPTGSGEYMDLGRVAEEIQHRLIHIFGRDIEGRRATNGGNAKLDRDPHFRDYLQFYEVSTLESVLEDRGLRFFPGDSSSTEMMVVDSGLRTKLDGELDDGPFRIDVNYILIGRDSSRFTFCRAASPAAFPTLRRVRQLITCRHAFC